jgi:hypothetical protein
MPAGIRALLEWMARPVQDGREIVGVMPDGVARMRLDDPDPGRRTFDIVGRDLLAAHEPVRIGAVVCPTGELTTSSSG